MPVIVFPAWVDILDRSSPLRANTLYYVFFPVLQVAPFIFSVSDDEK
jgi:hypothetical protein